MNAAAPTADDEKRLLREPFAFRATPELARRLRAYCDELNAQPLPKHITRVTTTAAILQLLEDALDQHDRRAKTTKTPHAPKTRARRARQST